MALLWGAPVHATYLGTYGKTYPIEERDLLDVIAERFQALESTGKWDEAKREMQEKAKRYVERPPGVSLPRATKTRSYTYDPSVIVPYDVRDAEGRLFYPAGTAVNPLDKMQFTRTIVLFDGDDPKQTQWVRQLVGDKPQQYVLLMTAGPYVDLMLEWQIRLYFDQHGVYVKRFGIQNLPAVIRQDGKVLRVTELPPEV